MGEKTFLRFLKDLTARGAVGPAAVRTSTVGTVEACLGKAERYFELPLDSRTAASESFPRQIGTYTLLRKIGTGGMGDVYEALQAQPQRRVALKLIRSEQISDELLRRFSIEVQALGRLRHAGIARIYEGGTADTGSGAQPYFVMELVDGLPLDEYVVRHHVGIRECVTLVERVAEAVHHAHQQDVIHRDLKPANILVDKTGQPRILDFGVARIVGTELNPSTAVATHTKVGVVLGTLPYMSPEQTEGDPDHFDQRSDVYALGVIAYKLLAGRLPYQFAGGFIESIRIIQETTPERLGDIDRRLRGDLEAVVSKALAKERKHRYQSAQAFADDLRRVVNGQPISVVPATLAANIRRWTMREENIRQAGWAGMIACILVGLLAFFYVCVGLISWFWWLPLLPRDIRYMEFMFLETSWAVFLALLAWVNWRVTQSHVPSMWLALISSALVSAFTTSVLLGYYSYELGGVLRDPIVRTAFFTLFSLLAFLGVLMSLLALVTTYRLRAWDRPVIDKPTR
jgi:tRNA A-37 threonylcarbamoyl transferase component Bud32